MYPFYCKGWFTSPVAELSIVLYLLYWILWALFYYHRHSFKSDIDWLIIIIFWQYTRYPVLLYNEFRPITESFGHQTQQLAYIGHQTPQLAYIYSSSFKWHLYNVTIIWCLVNSSMKWNWSEVAYLRLYLLLNCIVQCYKVNFWLMSWWLCMLSQYKASLY